MFYALATTVVHILIDFQINWPAKGTIVSVHISSLHFLSRNHNDEWSCSRIKKTYRSQSHWPHIAGNGILVAKFLDTLLFCNFFKGFLKRYRWPFYIGFVSRQVKDKRTKKVHISFIRKLTRTRRNIFEDKCEEVTRILAEEESLPKKIKIEEKYA